jgi:hypothetical protein
MMMSLVLFYLIVGFPSVLKGHSAHFVLSLQDPQTALAGMNFTTKSVKIHSIVLVIGLFCDQAILRNAELI